MPHVMDPDDWDDWYENIKSDDKYVVKHTNAEHHVGHHIESLIFPLIATTVLLITIDPRTPDCEK